MLVVVTICGIGLGIVANRANRQRRAVAAIEAARGVVKYDFQRDADGQTIPNAQNPGPQWLRNLIGDHYFQRVAVVDFATEFYGKRKALGLSKIDDEGLAIFRSLPDVEVLDLSHNRAVTDDGLVRLSGLKNLRTLALYDCGVSGIGVLHLKHLPNLEIITLGHSPVSKEGLQALGQLPALAHVGLTATPITDDELWILASMSKLASLRLGGTTVTDAGLIHLQDLTRLEVLELPAGITDEGLRRMQVALPGCEVYRTRE